MSHCSIVSSYNVIVNIKANKNITYDEIVSDIDSICGSTSATYLAATKVRNINNAYDEVSQTIWNAADGWQFDDSNQTDLPIGLSDLVHNQKDYSLPSDTLAVQKVEILDSSGNYQLLKQRDLQDFDVATTEFLETAGMPQYYDIFGSSVNLYPTPSSAYATMTDGLKVYVDRFVSAFVTGSTSREPGFARPFHRILSLAASIDFERDKGTKDRLVQMKDRLEKGLVNFYSKRNIQRSANVKPHGKRYWRQYV